MSPNSDFSSYNKYLVTDDIPMKKGEIAPWYGASDGGIQYQIQDIFYTQLMSYADEGEYRQAECKRRHEHCKRYQWCC